MRYGESCCFGRNCAGSGVPPAGCLLKGTLIPTPNAARFSTNKDVDLTDAQVLSDDSPVFDKLNNKWNEEWRQLAIDNVLTEVVKYKIPFFR